MKFDDWPSAKTTPALYRALKQLGLLEHLAELDAFGYTVLPTDKVGSTEQLEEATAAVLRIAAERKGCQIDQLEELHDDGQELLSFELWNDPIVERLVLNPAALGLMFNRPHMQTQEAYRQTVTVEALARNPARFTRLMNVHHVMPWVKTPDNGRVAQAPQGYIGLFDTKPVGCCATLPEMPEYHRYDRDTGASPQAGMSRELTIPDHYKTKNSNG